jgi:hypothetical protein
MNRVGRWYRFAVAGYELLSETAGCGDGDLLTENRPYCQFKAIPSAGGAQAWTFCYQRREQGIAGEVAIDCFDVGTEVEEAAYATYYCWQSSDFGKQDGDGKALVTRRMRYFDAADSAIDLYCSCISVAVDYLQP